MSADYTKALGDACSGWEALRPPNRVSVAKGAAETLVIRQPGSAGGPWSADETPYMVEPMNALTSRRHEAVVFIGPARTGKALDVDTPIPTPHGFRRMGDLTAGDEVFGPDGAVTRVLVAHPVQLGRPCYEVVFSDGSSLVADEEHLWGVEKFYWKKPNWRYEVLTTRDLLRMGITYSLREDGRARYRFRVRQQRALQTANCNLPIDPYVLGVWLGNGKTQSGEIYQHRDDNDHYESALHAAGFTDVKMRLDGDSCTAIRSKRLGETLREAGLIGRKHIPRQYLRASADARIALLQGLMDTDGYVGSERVGCEFSTVVEELKDGFIELCRTLGLKPVAKEVETSWQYADERKHGRAWRIHFSVGNGLTPFTLGRKKRNFRQTSVDTDFRQIVSITPVESRPVRCIGVGNESHLFLAGEGFVPTHNTASLLQGWMTHNVVNDPGDMLFIQMSKDKAREFSKTDIDRAIRNSPRVRAMLSPRAVDSNTFDTMFRHGMWLRVAWPTVSNVSGSTYRYVAITDIDRMENAENVDGEGPLFDLAKKRTTTFMSRGMTLVESSPGRPFEDPKWKPATPHEGPPCKGIVALYNRSTRERFYWPCPDCHEFFEAKPGLDLFTLMPSINELIEEVRSANIPALARKVAHVVCPHCGSILEHRLKGQLNGQGLWLADGCTLTKDRTIVGTPLESTIRGFWLGGVAAFKQSWESIVTQYLYGLQEYALTGSEEKLKQTTNTDQGMPYMSRHLAEATGNMSSPRDRAEKDLKRYVAPEDARAVTVSVDVQGGQNARFDVQVHAVGPGGEQWVIDRFSLKESKRPGATDGTFAPIDPASYPEDWDVLTDRILLATWRTEHANLEIQPLAMIVDSGGEDGVTHNAYAWYRRVRQMGFGKRVFLYKGGSAPDAPDMRETLVGKIAGKGRNDIPLLHCNPNKLSDAVDANLRREVPGPGYIHFPAPQHPTLNPEGWVNTSFFDELEAEIRGKSGVWTKVRKRNETFDHCRMQRALHLRLGVYKVDDWRRVPATLAPIPTNSMTVTKADRREMQTNTTVAPTPTIVQPVPPMRRKRRSSMAAL